MLGLTRQATQQEIKEAYFRYERYVFLLHDAGAEADGRARDAPNSLIRKYHPDKGNRDNAAAQQRRKEISQKLNEAWAQLKAT